MKRLLVFTFFLVFAATVGFADPKGTEIAKKSFDIKKSKDSFAVATMVLIDKNENQKYRKLEMYSKEEPNGHIFLIGTSSKITIASL